METLQQKVWNSGRDWTHENKTSSDSSQMLTRFLDWLKSFWDPWIVASYFGIQSYVDKVHLSVCIRLQINIVLSTPAPPPFPYRYLRLVDWFADSGVVSNYFEGGSKYFSNAIIAVEWTIFIIIHVHANEMADWVDYVFLINFFKINFSIWQDL